MLELNSINFFLKVEKFRFIHLFKRICIFKVGKGRKQNYSISPAFESARFYTEAVELILVISLLIWR